MQFFIAMKPPTTTHQQKSVRVVNGKPMFYEPQSLKSARAKLAAHLAQHTPDKPMTGPLRMTVKWLFPTIKTASHGQWKHTRPDVDNLNKLLLDVMTRLGYWEDDAQVCSLVAEKFWADTPGLFVYMETL